MGLFDKKERDEESGLAGPGLLTGKRLLYLGLAVLGLVVGGTVMHFWIEPLLDNELENKLSACKASFNLVNKELNQCYVQAGEPQDQTNFDTGLETEAISDLPESEATNDGAVSENPDGEAQDLNR